MATILRHKKEPKWHGRGGGWRQFGWKYHPAVDVRPNIGSRVPHPRLPGPTSKVTGSHILGNRFPSRPNKHPKSDHKHDQDHRTARQPGRRLARRAGPACLSCLAPPAHGLVRWDWVLLPQIKFHQNFCKNAISGLFAQMTKDSRRLDPGRSTPYLA